MGDYFSSIKLVSSCVYLFLLFKFSFENLVLSWIASYSNFHKSRACYLYLVHFLLCTNLQSASDYITMCMMQSEHQSNHKPCKSV